MENDKIENISILSAYRMYLTLQGLKTTLKGTRTKNGQKAYVFPLTLFF